MPLSNKDLSDIAKEFGQAKGEQADDKTAIPDIQAQVVKKQEQADRMYILYNDAHLERVTPYETEHRWINGTTYTTITKSQIETFGADTGRNTYFFPISWMKPNAQLQPNGNGNPKSSSPNSESAKLNAAFEANGIISTLAFLRNGQASGAPTRYLDNSYSPGASTLTFTFAHSFNIGKYLYIAGSGTSALVRITAVTSLTVTIVEIIPPASTISIGGSAIESILGFTNVERQNLTSVSYQRILNQLVSNIDSSASIYATAVGNQLAQLKLNIDQKAQIAAETTSATDAQTAYSTWNALPSTGVGGKWADISLDNFAANYNARIAGFAARINQIVTALGSITQNPEGEYSGNGLYLQRYKCMNFLINSANGPLQQINGLKGVVGNVQQKVINTADKLATFSNLVSYGGFIKNPVGNSVEIDGVSQFIATDKVLLAGNDLPSVECTIVSISGKTIVLNITIPPAYNKASKAGIIKSI